MESKQTIVVTGGTGYIGSHTVVELLNSNFNVHIVDNLSNSEITMIDRIEIITGKRPTFTKLDLRNKKDVHDFFEGLSENSLAGVIHFAALKSVGESVEKPLLYYENNIIGLTNLLEATKKANVDKFVFSSSCTVYGSPESLPVTEETVIGYTPSPYGYTKQVCERILDDSVNSITNFKVMSLRYFNPLGAHESKLIGELPTGIPNNLLPYITQTAIGLRDKLKVFGFDYNTPDGTAIRDYIHVSDLAKAHVKALEYLIQKEGQFHEKLNIGTGKGLSVMDIIQSFERTSGLKLKYEKVDRRAGDVEAIYADTTKAQEVLDWQAELSVDDMTRSAWNWELEYRGGKQ